MHKYGKLYYGRYLNKKATTTTLCMLAKNIYSSHTCAVHVGLGVQEELAVTIQGINSFSIE